MIDMKNILSPTEELKKTHKTIDQLNTLDGIKLLLEDQKESLNAINKIINDLSFVTEQIYFKLIQFKSSRLIYVGAGTSGRIAIQDGVELLPTFGWPKKRLKLIMAGGNKALLKSVEFSEDNIKEPEKILKKNKVCSKDVVIGLAASGNTPFTCKILELSSKLNSLTIGITNNPNGDILNHCRHKIVLNTKGEVIAGSTRMKAGTSQKICLNLISTMLMVKLGKVKNGYMTNMIPSNKKLFDRQIRIKSLLEESM